MGVVQERSEKDTSMDGRRATVTRLIARIRSGESDALNRLMSLVYDELHEVAHRHRRNWHGDLTLNTTAVLHEAYLRLAGGREDIHDRSHFMAVAATAMRHLLVDHARRRRALKRGGDVLKFSLDEMLQGPRGDFTLDDARSDEILALNEALDRLSRVHDRQKRVVECRFFAGMSVEETAAALGVSAATVKLDWAQARRWLYNELQSPR